MNDPRTSSYAHPPEFIEGIDDLVLHVADEAHLDVRLLRFNHRAVDVVGAPCSQIERGGVRHAVRCIRPANRVGEHRREAPVDVFRPTVLYAAERREVLHRRDAVEGLVRLQQRNRGRIDGTHCHQRPMSMGLFALPFTDSIEVTPASYAREAWSMFTISSTTLTFGYST